MPAPAAAPAPRRGRRGDRGRHRPAGAERAQQPGPDLRPGSRRAVLAPAPAGAGGGQPGQRVDAGRPGRGRRSAAPGWPAAPDRLFVGTGYRLPVPPAPAFCLGNVILTRLDGLDSGSPLFPARGQARHPVRLLRRGGDGADVPRGGGRVLGADRRLRRPQRVRAAGRAGRRRLHRQAAAARLPAGQRPAPGIAAVSGSGPQQVPPGGPSWAGSAARARSTASPSR